MRSTAGATKAESRAQQWESRSSCWSATPRRPTADHVLDSQTITCQTASDCGLRTADQHPRAASSPTHPPAAGTRAVRSWQCPQNKAPHLARGAGGACRTAPVSEWRRSLRSSASCLGSCTDDDVGLWPTSDVFHVFEIGATDVRDPARARPANAGLSHAAESEEVSKCRHERYAVVRSTVPLPPPPSPSPKHTSRHRWFTRRTCAAGRSSPGHAAGYDREHRDATPRAPSLSRPGRTVKSFRPRAHRTRTGALTRDTPFSSKASIATKYSCPTVSARSSSAGPRSAKTWYV